jgi:hypothetical protein
MNTRTLKRLTKTGRPADLIAVAAFFPIFEGIDLSLSTPELREAMLKRLKETKTATK